MLHPVSRRTTMDVYEAIEKRRTIRIYKKGASEKELRKIILAASKAPSGGNSQPWEFIIIDDPKLIEQFAELKYQLNKGYGVKEGDDPKEAEGRALKQKASFKNASIVAVCCEEGGASGAWLSIENVSLAATADGLGSGIVTYWDRQKLEAERLLNLPEGYELIAIMKIGVPGEEGFARDKNPVRPGRAEFSWLHRNKFGNRI
jgi:5,6-dimethylbenzimidazole synthase